MAPDNDPELTTNRSRQRAVQELHGSRLDIQSRAASRDGQVSLRVFAISTKSFQAFPFLVARANTSRVMMGGSTKIKDE